MTYYIETLTKKQSEYLDKPGIIDLTGKSEKEIYNIYVKMCSDKQYYHLALRHFNGWLHGLISEWFSFDEKPFWYTNYNEYKEFINAVLGV